MSRLVWSAAARRDLARLREFIGEKDPVAAQDAARRILRAAALLPSRPELGRAVEGEAFRDLVAPSGRSGYVLRYRIDPEVVVIVRVWHTREERE